MLTWWVRKDTYTTDEEVIETIEDDPFMSGLLVDLSDMCCFGIDDYILFAAWLDINNKVTRLVRIF